MNIQNIVRDIPNAGSNGRRELKDIVYAVVHHDAVMVLGDYVPAVRYASEAKYHLSNPKNFGKRFAYHVKIDSKGNVYQTVPFEEITYHAGNYKVNLRSIGICLDGDFTKQKLPTVQAEALIKVLDWLCFQRPDMPSLVRSTVRTHREVRLMPTSCPSNVVHELVKRWRKS